MKVKLIHKEEAQKLKNKIDKENEMNSIQNIKISKDEQKWFWLHIMLPAVLISSASIAGIVWLGKLQMNYLIQGLLRLLCAGVMVGAVANRTYDMIKKSSLTKILNPIQYPANVRMLSELSDSEIIDCEYSEDILPNDKTILRPVSLRLKNRKNQLETTLYLTDYPIQCYGHRGDTCVIDLETLDVFCPYQQEESSDDND